MGLKHEIRLFVKAILPRWLMIHKLKGDQNEVLLTFDDGPDPELTPRVLDILQELNKKAVFFVVGEKAEQHPELLKRIEKEGHIIGNHTYSHPHDRIISMAEYRQDVKKAQQTIRDITGTVPTIFRPPCGEFSLKTVLSAKSLGLQIMLMSNGGGEWNENASEAPEKVRDQIIEQIEAGQIIVMHDNNKKIPAMLQSLIEKIEAKNLGISSKFENLRF